MRQCWNCPIIKKRKERGRSMNGLGNWVLEEFTPCDLPQEVASGFTDVMNEMVGAHYIPLLYAATQLVAGKNYMIICESSLVAADPVRSLVAVYLHQELPVDGGAFRVLSIQPINIGI
ncbi:hypothetical protein [Lacrimispora sp.]|uniref:hypothetical protein n=1 Tax=Lacrimispora sp. TaxID=2719234 RepID=UPI0029E1D2A5|nr:hypothetical protein [Lacrimispora sp.]